MNAIDYFDHDNAALAAEYVATRAADAAKLLAEFVWKPHMDGVLRCVIYGHSILWDIRGTKLHACHTDYEIMPYGMDARADDPELGNLQQILAYILAKNW